MIQDGIDANFFPSLAVELFAGLCEVAIRTSMHAPRSNEPSPDLGENQRRALISLLADDDAAIAETVRGKLLSYGAVVGEWLRPYLLSEEPLLRRRARQIITHFERQVADTEFLSFCLKQGEEFDVEEGVWLLARTQYPQINVAGYRAVLDDFALELRERLDLNGSTEHILGVLNEFLFQRLKFTGNEKNYYDPENSYLNRVLDRRTGNPIGLCLVYLLLARRLKLPMAGIGLPGHFICRYQSSRSEVYVDVFNFGNLLTKGDCIKYLIRTNHGLHEGHLSPVSARRILLRICASLHQIYSQLEAAEEIARFQHYLVALAK